MTPRDTRRHASGETPASRPPETAPAASWQELQALFDGALELSGDARDTWVRQQCGHDPHLLERLRALLAAHEALHTREPGFLDTIDADHAHHLLQGPAVADPESIGRYRVRHRLGRGGMGVVYLAHDPALDRQVALKLLPPGLDSDPAANRRLLAEARAASALDHPHIATIYEVGETDDGGVFIAMAYCEGQTLRQKLDAGPLDLTEALAVATGVADGLAAAHRRGVVHRDIKPENIVCGPDGRIRIVDFGVAHVAHTLLTRSATPTAGTIAYMSPEQTQGTGDASADVWALGVILYEMLAGRRPFEADGSAALIHAIRHDEPAPLSSLRPDAPPPLTELVARCLAKDPQRRPRDAAELAAALRAGGSAEPGLSWRNHGLWLRAGLYAGVATAVFHAFSLAADRFLLPAWATLALLAVLAGGFPLLAAARMRPHTARTRRRRLVPALALAVLALAAASGFFAVTGMPRVTGYTGDGDAMETPGWVVLADFTAGADAADVTAAIREALSVDLQQSDHVAVLSRSQVAAVLRTMDVADSTPLAAPLAMDVAERAGAGAVLTVDVRRLGAQYVLSGRALRPGTGEELFAVRAASAEHRLLEGVEALSRAMRRRLGEARDEVRRSRPLPAVTTSSMEALRLYAEAERLSLIDQDAAAALVARALAIDPGFAMAHRLAGALATSHLRFGDARHHLTRAWELRDRLTDRERWHVEAIYHATVTFEPHQAVHAYQLLLQRYPLDGRAANNMGSLLQSWLADDRAALPYYLRAVELDPFSPLAIHNAIVGAFIAGEPTAADSLARLAEDRGFDLVAQRWWTARAVATGDHDTADARCADVLAGSPRQPFLADDYEFCGSADVAGGRVEKGIGRLEQAARMHADAARHRNLAHALQGIVAAHALRGDDAAVAMGLRRVLREIPADAVPEPDRFITRTNLQVQAALHGRPDIVREIAAAYPAYPDPGHWLGRAGTALVQAALAIHDGAGDTALRTLRAGWPSDRDAIGWRIWHELLAGMAFDLMAQPDSASARFSRAADPRLHAMHAMTKNRLYLPVALQRLAEANAAAGDAGAAAAAYRQLLELWHDADEDLAPAVASIRAAAARLMDTPALY